MPASSNALNLASERAAMSCLDLFYLRPPALMPTVEPNQGMLVTDRALAAGRTRREAFVALDLNEIHFQKSPGSHRSFQAERDHLRTWTGREKELH